MHHTPMIGHPPLVAFVPVTPSLAWQTFIYKFRKICEHVISANKCQVTKIVSKTV